MNPEPSPSAPYTISLLRSADELARWDGFVCQSPQANPFASLTWLQTSARLLDCALDIWVAARGDDWLCGAPVFWRRRLGQRVGFVPPLSAYHSFLYSPRLAASRYPSKVTAEHLALSRALAQALMKRYGTVKHLLHWTVADVRPWQWLSWDAIPRYSYHLSLDAEPAFSHAVRKHIRKCNEAGFTLSTDWNLAGFWQLYQQTQDRQRFSAGLDRGAFFELAEAMKGSAQAWMISALSPQGEMAASRIELSLPGSHCLFDWVAGGAPEFLASGVNPWLMRKPRPSARQRGYTLWDLCGADVEPVARFKGEFGGQLVHYFQVESPRPWFWQSLRALRGAALRLKRRVAR